MERYTLDHRQVDFELALFVRIQRTSLNINER